MYGCVAPACRETRAGNYDGGTRLPGHALLSAATSFRSGACPSTRTVILDAGPSLATLTLLPDADTHFRHADSPSRREYRQRKGNCGSEEGMRVASGPPRITHPSVGGSQRATKQIKERRCQLGGRRRRCVGGFAAAPSSTELAARRSRSSCFQCRFPGSPLRTPWRLQSAQERCHDFDRGRKCRTEDNTARPTSGSEGVKRQQRLKLLESTPAANRACSRNARTTAPRGASPQQQHRQHAVTSGGKVQLLHNDPRRGRVAEDAEMPRHRQLNVGGPGQDAPLGNMRIERPVDGRDPAVDGQLA
ncbi:hypothetical protein QFZ57_001989 [Arthrobacter sp. B1I2]|nr:hypothetical protein [Arthrobacter sp. B1I2]